MEYAPSCICIALFVQNTRKNIYDNLCKNTYAEKQDNAEKQGYKVCRAHLSLFLLDSKDKTSNPKKHNNNARSSHCILHNLKDYRNHRAFRNYQDRGRNSFQEKDSQEGKTGKPENVRHLSTSHYSILPNRIYV